MSRQRGTGNLVGSGIRAERQVSPDGDEIRWCGIVHIGGKVWSRVGAGDMHEAVVLVGENDDARLRIAVRYRSGCFFHHEPDSPDAFMRRGLAKTRRHKTQQAAEKPLHIISFVGMTYAIVAKRTRTGSELLFGAGSMHSPSRGSCA